MIVELVEEHAEEAAFLWRLREAAAGDPHYNLADLAQLDGRVEAHLDGLRLAGEAGWQACVAALEEDADAGAVFAATATAVERTDIDAIAAVLEVAAEVPGLAVAMGAALEWLPFETTAAVLPGLLSTAGPVALQRLGIEAAAAHRRHPAQPLSYALTSEDPDMRATAARAVGRLGLVELGPDISAGLDRPQNATSQFWSSWALARLGDARAANDLASIALSGNGHAEEASAMAVCRLEPDEALRFTQRMAELPDARRNAIRTTGLLGAKQRISWLLERMHEPALARLAAEAFTMITGADVSEELAATQPADFSSAPNDDPDDDDVALDPDENLPWPNADAIATWWSEHGPSLDKQRLLLGRPRSAQWLQQVLIEGRQRQRGAAAIELAAQFANRPLFNVRAPAFRQQQQLL